MMNLKTPLIAFLFLLPALVGFRHIPQGASEEILNIALKGQQLIFNRHYTEAEDYFEKISKDYPNSALGTFGLMSLYNTMMFENFDFLLDDKFEQARRRSEVIVNKILQDTGSSAWENFLCGSSKGLSGFYLVRKDAYLQALDEANGAKTCLDRTVEKDPLFKDVYLGFGLFNYWKSVFTSRIKFLPFFKDRRQEGIDQIRLCIQEGVIAADLAKSALVFVYHESNHGGLGLPLTQELLKSYPKNIIMRNIQGNFLSLLGRYAEAKSTLEEVLKMDPSINVARYFSGLNEYRQRKYDPAKLAFQSFLDHQPTPAWQAYAHHMLGILALQKGQEEEAFKHFQKGHKAYSHYNANLDEILKMRRKASHLPP